MWRLWWERWAVAFVAMMVLSSTVVWSERVLVWTKDAPHARGQFGAEASVCTVQDEHRWLGVVRVVTRPHGYVLAGDRCATGRYLPMDGGDIARARGAIGLEPLPGATWHVAPWAVLLVVSALFAAVEVRRMSSSGGVASRRVGRSPQRRRGG